MIHIFRLTLCLLILSCSNAAAQNKPLKKLNWGQLELSRV